MINISVEIGPGKGRVLVQTKPLMGTVFQDAANTAVYIAQNKTGMTIIEQVPTTIDAKQYIEENTGIKVEYVDNIDDILKYAT